MKNFKTVTFVFLLSTLNACGEKSSQSKGAAITQNEEILSDGVFKAILRPYNFTAAGWIPNGMADLKILGNEFEVKSWLDDSANVIHKQNIHTGTKCPSLENDTNKDGFVDENETTKISGHVFLALDNDLNSQDPESSLFPKGNFAYFESGQISDSIEGKVIIISGTATDPNLPIACGVIERMPEA